MKKGERKKPDIYNDPLAVLTPEEKARLRAMLVDPVFVKLMRVCERYKPSSNCANAGSATRDAFSNDRANARLGEIRGWELHLASFYSVLTDSAPPKTPTEPTYSQKGTMDLEPRIPDQK